MAGSSGTGTGWQPEREVELVAGTPAGGGQDRPARALLELLRSAGGVEVPLKLTNIPGRGGGNGWDHLAQHPGDPHVLAINSPTIVSNRLLGVSKFDHAALTPLATLYTESLVFAVRADSAIRTAADLLARFRDPAELPIAFATAIGNMNHIALAKVTRHAGGDVRALRTTVFDSARYAVAHVLERQSELVTVTATSTAPELAAGTLGALVLSAPSRLGGPFAEVPIWRELGVDCDIGMWRGVIGAPGLAPPAAAFWEAALRRAARSEAWRAELARHHWADTWLGSAATTAFLDRERATIGEMLGALGLLGTTQT
jgi:putative tricarboxylic transport membrane protein